VLCYARVPEFLNADQPSLSSASVLPEFAPWKREPEEVESLVTCRKYILEAGCDPTLPLLYAPDSDVYSALVDCLSSGTPVRILSHVW
jgi:hypothetical protein